MVDGFASTGRCEFVADFADHYPVQVICEVLGAPREDHERFARWGDALTYVLSLELSGHLDEVEQASSALREYVSGLVAQRQAEHVLAGGLGGFGVGYVFACASGMMPLSTVALPARVSAVMLPATPA